MLRELLIIWSICITVNGNVCKECKGVEKLPVCGSDNITYSSYCELMRIGCERGVFIKFKCNKECPCDPPELIKLDKKTVRKLAKLRKRIQLENHEEEFDNDSDDIVTLEILENHDQKTLDGEEDKGYSQNFISNGCPPAEKAELPRRLIDWFHVLKTNEREQLIKDEGITEEPVLKELNFVDAKLKAMYTELACGDNDVKVEEEVCLPSVKWMFYHLDSNKDTNLSEGELFEIEEINNEHCIRPFLQACDRDNNKEVVLTEFCKCLCLTPPCTRALESIPSVLIHGVPQPFPGMFTPTCDEDGFFMPMQHNKRKGEFWCVDRNGAEVDGTRNKTEVKCTINTRLSNKHQNLKPLDMQKENEPGE